MPTHIITSHYFFLFTKLYTKYAAGGGSFEPLKQQPSGQYAAVSNTKDNPPCNTLFVGNLGDTVDEAELQGLFWRPAGAPFCCCFFTFRVLTERTGVVLAA